MNTKNKTIQLPYGVALEMIYIPGGTFLMGSPENDSKRFADEIPQHRVKVAEFWISKYTITQAQWRSVASLLQLEQELDPDPSHFKGNNRPVERVSWYDAMEFCDRLFVYIGQTCTLPSEAQWEYACCAGSHISETITPDLANYKSDNATYRQETTEVGSFFPNNFGLYDMRGNVFEWCLDHWHSNYHGAPANSKAWVDLEAEKTKPRILRGGSWFNNPWNCRCACRFNGFPGYRYYLNGFRIVICNY